MSRTITPGVIWALGVTQIVGYGTLYYSFAVLAPAIGQSFGWSYDWMYAALSAALLAGGLAAPFAGRLVDRVGAARTMTIGSILVALTLAATAAAPDGWLYAAGLIAMEIASTAVLYAAAFALLVERGGTGAQRSITHLTLIAGFASTLFWPLTAGLASYLSWQQVYLVFAALTLLVSAPLHLSLMKLGPSPNPAPPASAPSPPIESPVSIAHANIIQVLLLIGFAIEGFVLTAVLMHIVPLLQAFGLATVSILVTTLFGPAQVLSRVVNMLFGRTLRQLHLAVIAAALPPLGIAILLLTAPSPLGGILFAILFGLGSGLTSIVSGSLPLELFGESRYGTRLGALSSARQIAAALAPFVLALLISSLGPAPGLWVAVIAGTLSVAVFTTIEILSRRRASLGPAVADLS